MICGCLYPVACSISCDIKQIELVTKIPSVFVSQLFIICPHWTQYPFWLHPATVFLGKVAEEIVLQRLGNALQKGDVNIVFSENLVHMCTGAANVLSQLCGCDALLTHYLLDMLPDVHKKRGIDYLSVIGFPLPPYQQVIPRQKKLAFHNGFLIWCLKRDGVENDDQEFVLKCYSNCLFVYLSVFLRQMVLGVNGAKLHFSVKLKNNIIPSFLDFA